MNQDNGLEASTHETSMHLSVYCGSKTKAFFISAFPNLTQVRLLMNSNMGPQKEQKTFWKMLGHNITHVAITYSRRAIFNFTFDCPITGLFSVLQI